MSVIPGHIENASFEAHMAAAEKIAAALGIERAKPGDVALALAHAYGEAVGLGVAGLWSITSAKHQISGSGFTTSIVTEKPKSEVS